MPDDRDRTRTPSPLPIPVLSPQHAGKLVHGLTRLQERCRSFEIEIARLESMVEKHETALEKAQSLNSLQIQELRVSISNLADSTRDISTTKRLVSWGIGILAPLLIIGFVQVVQSMSRQSVLEKSSEATQQKYLVVQTKIHGIETDVSTIKHEQAATRKTLEKVSDTLQDLKESQVRMEESIRPRSRRSRQ